MGGARLGSRLWWGLVPLVVLLWGAGSLVATALPGLPEAPVLTLSLLPGAWFARDVTLAVTVGALVVLVRSPGSPVRAWALGWGAASLGLVLAGAVALRADVAAVPITDYTSGPGLESLLTATLAGRAILVQASCLTAALLLTLASSRTWTRWVAVGLGLVAAGAPGFAGHAGLSGPHAAAAVSVALHVAAVSVWIGGLAVVSALIVREPERTAVVLPAFSAIALACVIIVAESGLLTASLSAGSLGELLGSTYGSIVVAKMALLAFLIRLGWIQRRRAVDRLPSLSVPRTVATIAGAEFLVMGTAMAAAVVLARIGTPAVPTPGFAPLTLVTLGLAAPMVAVLVVPRGWGVSDALPEAAAVVLLVVIVEVGGVGLFRALLGGLGLVIELVLLVGAGWLAVSASRRREGRGAIVVLLVGLPIALLACARLADGPSPWRMALVAAVAGEVLLALWWLRQRQVTGPDVDAGVLVAG